MERLIVFALLFLLPTQLAYHFWPQFSYILGLRVDYISPAIYLTDILILFLIPYLIKRIRVKKVRLNRSSLVILLSIILLALLNILFAQSPVLALLKWLSILKFALLGVYFYLCDLTKLKRIVVLALSLSLLIFALIGLAQFILQRTVGGLLYYLGERSFTFQAPGIALMNLFGNSVMRAYSTFSHPNSFAGFVVVSLFILLSFNFQHMGSIRKIFVVFAVVLSLLITLSLNTLIGLGLVVVFWLVSNKSTKVIQKIKVLLPILLIGFSFLFGVMSVNLLSRVSLRQTYKERVVLADQAIATFVRSPLLGVGLNNFFIVTKNLQPPHNIYLIVLAETGLIGILLLYLLLSKLLNKYLNKYLLLALIFVLFTGLFDHYWFTLQQNKLILSILLGLSLKSYNIRNE